MQRMMNQSTTFSSDTQRTVAVEIDIKGRFKTTERKLTCGLPAGLIGDQTGGIGGPDLILRAPASAFTLDEDFEVSIRCFNGFDGIPLARGAIRETLPSAIEKINGLCRGGADC